MANATFLRTKDAGQEPNRKGIAVVDVDGEEVEVTYWPSLIDQWGVPAVKAYVEAEALFAQGHYADARAKAQAGLPAPYGDAWANEHPDPPLPLV